MISRRVLQCETPWEVYIYIYIYICIYTSRWTRFACPAAACDLDIFHYITAYIHNMHAIEAFQALSSVIIDWHLVRHVAAIPTDSTPSHVLPPLVLTL